MAKKKNEEEHNALACLSEALSAIYVFNNTPENGVIDKAARIIAELSKIRCHAPFNEIPFGEDVSIAYRNCRAIAEEGEKQ